MTLRITSLFLLTFSMIWVNAQEAKTCGTILDEATHQLISERLMALQRKSLNQNLNESDENVDKIAITAHIVRRDDGSGGLTEAQLADALLEVNEFYLNAKLEFFIFDKIDYVDSDLYFDFDSNYEDEIADFRDIENTINIYFVNSLTSESSALCGYAYFPGNPDRIFMDNGCTVNGTTLSHEIGHYFTLYHTHGRTNTGTTDELVDGSNCQTAGDELCDTSADPNLTGNVDQDCKYTGLARDANGDLFTPDPSNIMSYSRQSCRRLFSFDQYDRIRDGFLSSRAYLHQKEYLADFVPQISVGCVADEIAFIDHSRGSIQNVLWEFEGGSPAQSTEISPSIAYTDPGVYDVSLTVYGDDGGSHIKYISNAITIVDYDTPLEGELSHGFEIADGNSYQLFSPEDDFSFTTSTVGMESAQSITMEFFDYPEKGREDYLLFNPLANPGVLDNVLSFDYAFSYRANNGANEAFDEVSILYKGCDDWQVLWRVNGKDGATADPSGSKFVPEASEWVHFESYLPVPEGSDFIQLAIQTVNGNGNNFYLDNLSVTQSNSLIVRNIEVTAEQCAGDETGKISVEASYNGEEVLYSLTNENFSPSGLFENLKSDEYTVYIMSGTEILQKDVVVTSLNPVPPKPLIVFSSDELRLLTNDVEIEWYLNDELINDLDVNNIPFQGAGVYYVIVRNASGCESISEPFTILSTSTNEEVDPVEIYPNPVKDELNIVLNSSQALSLRIIDLSGHVWSKAPKFDGSAINVSHLPSGIYLIVLESKTASTSYKIMKD